MFARATLRQGREKWLSLVVRNCRIQIGFLLAYSANTADSGRADTASPSTRPIADPESEANHYLEHLFAEPWNLTVDMSDGIRG